MQHTGRDVWLREHKPAWLAGTHAGKSRKALEPRVREAIAALDAKGRWVANGRIESRVFVGRVHTLCDYLSAD